MCVLHTQESLQKKAKTTCSYNMFISEVAVQISKKTRKSSCVNTRGIPSAAQQVFTVLIRTGWGVPTLAGGTYPGRGVPILAGAVADPGFGQGGGQEFFPRFCRHSEAKSGKQSEQYNISI